MDARDMVQSGLLGEAVDDAPVLVFVADENRRYVAVNRYACTLLGYERDELLGLSVEEVARYEEASDEYAGMVVRGAADGVSVLTRKDGSTFPLVYRASIVTVARMRLYVSIGWPVGD